MADEKDYDNAQEELSTLGGASAMKIIRFADV